MGNFTSTGSAEVPEISSVDNVIAPPWAGKTGRTVKVFFDIEIKGSVVGRIEMTLASEIAPRTSENFRALCTGKFVPRQPAISVPII